MGHPFGARARLRRILVREHSCSRWLVKNIGGVRPRLQPGFWYVPCVGVGTRSGPGGRRLNLLIGNFCRLFKDSHKHGAGQLSGLGVLVRGMVRGQ